MTLESDEHTVHTFFDRAPADGRPLIADGDCLAAANEAGILFYI